MAWLHAVPKPPDGSRRAKNAHGGTGISRYDQAKKDKIVPAMPPNPAPHIVARLLEIGITQPTGMGPAPLSWGEIAAWQRLTRIALAPWESRLMRQLSIDYIGELSRAESENCPPPWRTEVSEREKELELIRLQLVLG